jgi:hypothetical protein
MCHDPIDLLMEGELSGSAYHSVGKQKNERGDIMKQFDVFQLPEGTEVHLTIGEVYILDNSMSMQKSCTYQDIDNYISDGILKELRRVNKCR